MSGIPYAALLGVNLGQGLQVHGDTVECYCRSEGCGNLAGLEKRSGKGSVVALPVISARPVFDAKLKLLPTASKPLVNMSLFIFTWGMARVVAELLLLGRDELLPATKVLSNAAWTGPLLLNGGSFIIRSYSPMITIGGGRFWMNLHHGTKDLKPAF